MIQCERGHFYDENRFSGCPYCSQVTSQPKSVLPPVAPANMAIPQPSCGKTVAIEGMETEPQISKTVAIENFEENTPHVNKTVAIFEESSGLPSVGAPAAPAVPVAPVVPVPAEASAPVLTPAPSEVPASPAPSAIPSLPNPSTPDSHTDIPFNGVSEEPERVLTEDISVDIPSSLPVTGLGVTEHPEPLASEESFYTPSDRPYAVTGLGVKENPTPIPVDVGATFPIPAEGGNAAPAAQPGQAEAAAFAAFGFPGGPIPGMMPGMPAPGAPMAPAAPAAPAVPVAAPVDTSVEVTPVSEEIPVPAPVEESPVVEIPVTPVEEVVAAPVEEVVASPVEDTPVAPVEEVAAPVEEVVAEAPVEEAPVVPAAPSPMFIAPEAPRDPNATVSLTESDMDFIPRVHARAFLVCIDGPMTGASFVFQEKKAIIGRQKNYEIALFRDNSVSRSPHAILSYDKDAIRYTVSCGDADKRVMVNGAFISGETELKLYDVIGIGQSRLMFIPVCSDKFAW